MASNLSVVSLTCLLAALSGCIDTSRDGFVAPNDCGLNLRTTGAVEGSVYEVDGCSHGRTSFAAEEGMGEVEITMGATPVANRPFAHVELAFYEELGEAGDGTAVTVLLRIDETRQWQTPDGACVADYESEACSTDDLEDGVRYLVTAIDCAEPAESDTEEPVTIAELSFTSSCMAQPPQ